MAMSGGKDDGSPMMEMNTTPLIDVMLVLLVMLIITIPIQTHEVKLDMPHADAPPPLVQPTVVELDVDFDGTLTWNGAIVADRPSLEARFAQAAALPDQPEIHLHPNKLAAYSTVAMVLASAQRLGITRIGLVGNEQFIQN